MQLDLFEHSRDVVLRNAVIDALRSRDAAMTAGAIRALEADNVSDPWLGAFGALCGRLRLPVSPPLDRAAVAAVVRATEEAVPAARQVFGDAAETWLAPMWAELAAVAAGLPFDPGDEAAHAVPLLLRAGKWAAADACIETIPAWRFNPAPLSWKVEAACRTAGLDRAWPFFCELAWMDPQRAAALAPRLKTDALDRLVDRFDAELEGDGGPGDFAWFPAWTLIAEPRLASGVRATMRGDSAAERCARRILELLRCEREGRHRDLIEGRRRLRGEHPALFALYMRSR